MKLYSCHLCDKSNLTTSELARHFKSVHETCTFDCNICETTCENYANLIRHKKEAHKKINLNTNTPSKYQCDICDNMFEYKTIAGLKIHMQSKHEKARPRCDICKKTFANINGLNKHKKSEHGPVKSFKCELCDKEFKYKETMHRHKKEKHENHFEGKCDICNEIFPNLRQHLKSSHESLIKNLPCPSCDKLFDKRSHLKLHIKGVHEKERVYSVECNTCGKTFANRSSMENHNLVFHTNIRPFKCDFCDKGYILEKHLARHIRHFHENVKQFACDLCEKSYFTDNSLKYHFKKIHEKMTCNLCDKIFKNQICLTKHLL